MSHLNYLDLTDPGPPDFELDELDQQLKGLESIGEESREEGEVAVGLQAAAEALAPHQLAPRVCKLAARIYAALDRHQQAFYTQPPSGFPLSPAGMRRYRLYVSAWRALGQTYARWCFAGEQIETDALVGAMACLGQIVRLCGFYHHPWPEGLWKDLHLLFQQAQEREVSRNKVKWPGLRHRAVTVPEWEYSRCLLLGLADSGRLLPQEVILLDSLLEKWAPLVKIVEDSGKGWHLHAASDSPARWLSAGEGRASPRLDMSELAVLIADHKHLAASVGRFEYWREPADTLSSELLDYLVRRWFQSPPQGGGFAVMDADWVVGLEAIFERLQGRTVEAIPVADESGRVRVLQTLPESLQVGDLVGVFAPHGGDLIGLAVLAQLRWSDTENLAEAGEPVLWATLEAVPGMVFPVGIQPLYRVGHPCDYQRGLLLAEQGRLSLLLAEQTIRDGWVVRLLYGDNLYPMRLGKPHGIGRGVLHCPCVSFADRFQK
ncbi:MAG: hypothetical protein Kow0060_16420 [Methylohalobius crimeensis]